MRIELEARLKEQRVLGITELKKKADGGDVEACSLLGKCLLAGLNCSPDTKMAVCYLEKAAKKGNTIAMINLALCYAEGRGMPKNFYMAELWIRAAEECGSKDTNIYARQIYQSTIGHHVPNIREYIEYLCKNQNYDEKNLNALFAQVVIGETGKKVSYEESLKTTLTANDIKSYEARNDVCYGDPITKEKVNFSNAEKEAVLKDVVQTVAEYDRTEIAKRLEILYHLCSDKEFKQQIFSMGCESSSRFKCNRELAWFTRAQYGLVKPLFASFDKKILASVMEALRIQLDCLEEEELSKDLKDCNNNLKSLFDLRVNVGRKKLYSKEIAQKYIEQITQKIVDLQNFAIETKYKQRENDLKALRNLRSELRNKRNEYEAEVFSAWERRITDKLLADVDAHLSKEFESIKDNYVDLCKMLQDLKHSEQEKEVLVKWEPLLSKQIIATQKVKLAELCTNLGSKSHKELTSLVNVIKEKYSFDSCVAKDYINKLEEAIDEVEIKKLEEITVNISGLTYSQYDELIAEIKKLNFNHKNTQQYLNNAEQGKRFTAIDEACTDDILEDCGLGKLQANLLTIEGLTFQHNKQAELVNRLNKYINLFKEAKDKKTLALLEKCEAENISKQSLEVIDGLIKAVDNHQFLPDVVKLELIERLDAQVSILNIEKRYEEAKDNFDNLVHVLELVKGKDVAQDYKVQKGNQIRERILELMVEASKKTTSDLAKQDLRQLRQATIFVNRCISVAQKCDIQTSVFDEMLVEVKAQYDVAENEELTKICSGLANATLTTIVSVRDRIAAGGFTKENQAKYMALVDERYADLRFEELQKKCTAKELFLVYTKEEAIPKLLVELKGLGRSGEEIRPYVDRLTKFLEVKKSFIEEAVSGLQLRYVETIREFIRTEMRAWEHYSACIFNLDRVNEVQKLYKNVLTAHEYIVFAFNGMPDSDVFAKGLVLTNFGFHYICEDKYIPIEKLKSISSGMFFKSVTVKGEDNEITIDVPWDSSVRKAFANDLWKVVAKINKLKHEAEKEFSVIKNRYMVKFEDCLEDNPVPNDNFSRTTQRGGDSIGKYDEPVTDSRHSVTGAGKLAKLSDSELGKFIQNLFIKYNVRTFYAPCEMKFESKLKKAIASYAFVDSDERCLMMWDFTIFGSATDGFVFTNKNIYFNNSAHKKQCVAIDDITRVYDSIQSGMRRIYVSTNKGEFWFAGGDKDNTGYLKIFVELIDYLKKVETCDETAKESIPIVQITSSTPDKWQCKCGNINTNNFCGNCGANKKDAVPTTWRCSCGSVNKGNFCGNCGSRRKD